MNMYIYLYINIITVYCNNKIDMTDKLPFVSTKLQGYGNAYVTIR